jgi:hypothetical protein
MPLMFRVQHLPDTLKQCLLPPSTTTDTVINPDLARVKKHSGNQPMLDGVSRSPSDWYNQAVFLKDVELPQMSFDMAVDRKKYNTPLQTILPVPRVSHLTSQADPFPSGFVSPEPNHGRILSL